MINPLHDHLTPGWLLYRSNQASFSFWFRELPLTFIIAWIYFTSLFRCTTSTKYANRTAISSKVHYSNGLLSFLFLVIQINLLHCACNFSEITARVAFHFSMDIGHWSGETAIKNSTLNFSEYKKYNLSLSPPPPPFHCFMEHPFLSLIRMVCLSSGLKAYPLRNNVIA